MYLTDIVKHCPLYQKHLNKVLENIDLETAISMRMFLVDVQIKEPRELNTRKEVFNINKRLTTVQGFSRSYEFYSPQYPEGPVLGDVDYRRTLYWNPNVVTDSTGTAQVEFYNNSYSTNFNISGAGITASGVPYILNQNW